MKRKIGTTFKYIAIVCMIILIIELIHIGQKSKSKSIYFDGINSVIGLRKGYVTVGSNNNNDKFFEKAKLTKYSDDKEKIFEKIYNKGFNGVFFDVIEDKEGNLIAVGSFESTEEDHAEGRRVGLVVKYDKDGNLLYENTYKILDNSKFTSVEVVEDGYIVTGQSIYGNMVVGTSKDGGAIIIKYDDKLEFQWSNNFGDSKTACFNDLLINNNDIYVVGVDEGMIGIINKYDMSGELIDTVRYDYTDKLGFTGIGFLNEKLLVSGSKKKDSSNEYDSVLVSYGMNLEFTKEIIYDEGNNERYNQIVIDRHDNVLVVGTIAKHDKSKLSESVNVFTYDGLIGKYDDDLEKISVVKYGDERDDYFTDIIVSKDNYLVAGYSSYEDGSYLSKFITYSDALKMLGVE